MKTAYPVHRLSPDFELLIPVLRNRPRLRFCAENTTTGLSAITKNFDPIRTLQGWYSDPDNGLAFRTGNQEIIHSLPSGDPGNLAPQIEIAFSNASEILRFESPETHDATEEFVALATTLFSRSEINISEFHQARKNRNEKPTCPCCKENGELRAEYAALHPLFDILMDSARRERLLQFRIDSDDLEAACEFIPSAVTVHEGVIGVGDETGESQFSIDMRGVHALAFRSQHLDGSDFSSLTVFDSFGIKRLQIGSRFVEDTTRWQTLCEEAKRYL